MYDSTGANCFLSGHSGSSSFSAVADLLKAFGEMTLDFIQPAGTLLKTVIRFG